MNLLELSLRLAASDTVQYPGYVFKGEWSVDEMEVIATAFAKPVQFNLGQPRCPVLVNSIYNNWTLCRLEVGTAVKYGIARATWSNLRMVQSR